MKISRKELLLVKNPNQIAYDTKMKTLVKLSPQEYECKDSYFLTPISTIDPYIKAYKEMYLKAYHYSYMITYEDYTKIVNFCEQRSLEEWTSLLNFLLYESSVKHPINVGLATSQKTVNQHIRFVRLNTQKETK